MRRWIRRTLLVLTLVLYAVSIPWYREAGAEPTLWLGLPDWVAVAFLCYLGAAISNAVAWMLTDVPEVEADDPEARKT